MYNINSTFSGLFLGYLNKMHLKNMKIKTLNAKERAFWRYSGLFPDKSGIASILTKMFLKETGNKKKKSRIFKLIDK